MSNAGHYDVGYKKTPLHTRWPDGQTGNPSGRPKKKKLSEAELLSKALETLVTITDEKGSRIVTAREALVERLFHDAMAGDTGAAKNLDILLRKSEATAPAPEEGKPTMVVFVRRGDRIVQNGKITIIGGKAPDIAATDPIVPPAGPESAGAEPSVAATEAGIQADLPHTHQEKSAKRTRPQFGEIVKVPVGPD